MTESAVAHGVPPFVAPWREHGARLKRRVVTIPFLGMIWVGLLAALVPALFLLAIFDLLRPTKPWARCRAVLAITWIATCEVLGVIAAFLLWLAFLVHRNRLRFLRHNSVLQRVWTNTLFSGSRRIFSMRLQVEGLDLAKKGPFLILVRHASLVDTVLTASVLANPHQLRLRYVLKDELLRDPCIDIVGNRLPNAFVSRGSKLGPEVARVRALACDLGAEEGVLIYPEGTRFSSAKLKKVQKRLAKDPVLGPSVSQLRHVLPPRPSGTLALLQAAPDLDVVIVAHKGLEGAATLSDFWRGDLVGVTVKVDIKRIVATDIPPEARLDPSWLYEQWLEVDAWVDAA